jgi:predicted phage-related endonuclease
MSVIELGRPGYLAPGSDEWARIITPSKVAAILGVSRWESPYRLWHRMKGLVPPDAPKDAFDLGHDMEAYAAARWLRRNPGWHVSRGEVQFHPPAGHYDFPCVGTIDRRASRGSWRRVVEVKMARNQTDLEAWGDDLSGECPEDYAAQITAQRMFVAAAQPGAAWLPVSHLLVVGPYFNERIYEIDYDPSVAAWIIEECSAFWASLQHDTPPPLDDSVATYECLKALHPDIEKGEAVNIEPGLALDYLETKAFEKQAKALAQLATNRLAAAMKRAQYARVGDVTVADRRSNGKGGVSLYAGRSATPDQIRHLEGITA